jgi:AcrR family transcriptional regulator
MEHTSRRAPTPETRKTDAERSRRRLLDAALDEFSEKGFAGARVRDIADRAGVNKQLVNYHFGGKEGLYLAVQRSWPRVEQEFADPSLPLDELAVRYLHNALRDPRPTRLLAWRGLSAAEAPPDASAADDLSGTRARKERGELAPDIDPATLRLMLLGAIAAPVVFPEIARQFFGVPPGSAEFEASYSEGLRALLKRLATAETD